MIYSNIYTDCINIRIKTDDSILEKIIVFNYIL